MTSAGPLVPRPQRGLSVRPAALAERVLGELALADPDILVVTRSCTHALHVAELYADRVRHFEDLWLAAGWAELGQASLLVVGSDVEIWPPSGLEDAAGASLPRLQWVRAGAGLFGSRGLMRQPGPVLHAVDADPGWTETSEGWCTRWRDGDASGRESRFVYEALVDRVIRLGKVCQSIPGWPELAPPQSEIVVHGGCVLVYEGDADFGYARASSVSGLGVGATTIDHPADLRQVLGRERIDAIFLHSCETHGVHTELLDGLRLASAMGIPTVSICTCCDYIIDPRLHCLGTNVVLPPSRRDLGRGIHGALLDRKAWLDESGESSEHLSVSLERPGWRAS